ncbi:MAG TPA: DUF92 domain-containing protein [Verrucomicrobiae bacterium]|nr:DUF92 domain-containing protein [Verrucomicrobiae bacterium]
MSKIGLTTSGAIAAAFIGAAVLIGAGWQGAAVLLAFFIPSTLLSRVGRTRKRALVDIGKQGARDVWQVLANGGAAAVAILLSLRYGAPLLAAFAGAFAAASADTWATEIGTLARGAPRSILTGRPLAPGISGGITAQGSLAQIAGALVVAVVAALVNVAALWPVLLGGVAGSIVDSILGATLQTLRYCPACARECETDPHACGTPTAIRRGLRWFDNDAVNFTATVCGAIVAVIAVVL